MRTVDHVDVSADTDRQSGSTSPRLMSWVPLLVAALLPWMLLFGRVYQVGDPDTFWHIRAGDFLLQTWQFSGPDPWSPFSSNTWVLHEWLPEVGLALADRIDGLGGVAWLWYAATCAVAVTLYASCRRHSPPSWPHWPPSWACSACGPACPHVRSW